MQVVAHPVQYGSVTICRKQWDMAMRSRNNESGFTLIELLSVMSITSILAAIAIPQYAGYRANSFDRRAQQDLRAVAMAEEAYFVDHDSYADCDQSSCTATLGTLGLLSNGVVLNVTTTPSGFSATATHPQGSGEIFRWDQ